LSFSPKFRNIWGLLWKQSVGDIINEVVDGFSGRTIKITSWKWLIKWKRKRKKVNVQELSEQEKILKWKLILEAYEDRLKNESNIFLIDWIWYFWDASGHLLWRKYLRSFPSSTFNKKNWLWNNTWNKKWFIENIEQLKELFSFMWLRVATEEEEILRWKEIIESYRGILESECWIILNNWKWDFSKSKNYMFMRNIFRNFPNATFNKKHGLWNYRWFIESMWDLEKLFVFFYDLK
jgi:hypothetical protein